MWNLWKMATRFGKLPSEVFDTSGEGWKIGGRYGPLARFMFDSCVAWFGSTIENLEAERVTVNLGTKTESKPKYTLARLLADDFRVIRTKQGTMQSNPFAQFLMAAGNPKNRIKRYVYKAPEPEKTVD